MGATTERARIIDETIAGLRVQQGAGAGRICGQRLAARCTKGFRCDERFAFGEVRRAAGQLEMAALLQSYAITIDRPRLEIGVDLANFVERRIHSFDCSRDRRSRLQLPGHRVAGDPAGRPRRLKIEAASHSVEVEQLAGEIEMRRDAAFHRFEIDLAQTHTAASDKLIFV